MWLGVDRPAWLGLATVADVPRFENSLRCTRWFGYCNTHYPDYLGHCNTRCFDHRSTRRRVDWGSRLDLNSCLLW
jgi:hypothetical protein